MSISLPPFLPAAGALPFWVFSPAVAPLLPLDLLLEPSMLASTGLLQVGYGATILSFLGGVHWGLAMTNVGGTAAAKMCEQRYLWSVLPCLMAWPTVAMPVPQAAGIQVWCWLCAGRQFGAVRFLGWGLPQRLQVCQAPTGTSGTGCCFDGADCRAALPPPVALPARLPSPLPARPPARSRRRCWA